MFDCFSRSFSAASSACLRAISACCWRRFSAASRFLRSISACLALKAARPLALAEEPADTCCPDLPRLFLMNLATRLLRPVIASTIRPVAAMPPCSAKDAPPVWKAAPPVIRGLSIRSVAIMPVSYPARPPRGDIRSVYCDKPPTYPAL